LNRRFSSVPACIILTLVTVIQAPAQAQNMFSGLAIDGIRCEASEGAVEHVHTHLQLFQRGRAVSVPAQIGMPAGAGCLYWVHTHSGDGVIHIEAPIARTFTLGQFFDIWNTTLTRTQADRVHAPKGHTLRVTVNGTLWTRDPRSIPLRDREEIVIQSGPPYTSGHSADWSKL
jgi:hypothetical protein